MLHIVAEVSVSSRYKGSMADMAEDIRMMVNESLDRHEEYADCAVSAMRVYDPEVENLV